MRRQKSLARWIGLTALLAGAVVLLCSAPAWGRAGGGGGFGGGGGGGGGGGDGEIFVYLIWLAIEEPVIGVPALLIVGGALVYAKTRATGSYRGRVIRRGNAVRNHQRSAAAVARLRERDPDFTEEAFINRVRAAFVKIQNAWCSQDLSDVSVFISDGIYERFSIQFEEQKALGYRDRMEKIRVQQAWVEDIQSNDIFDIVTVCITASAKDHRVDLATDQPIRGSRKPDQFTEFWSFVRHGDARTQAGQPGLMEGHCPNCGVAVPAGQSGQCSYCEATLRSCRHDWVLAEITQACEWQPKQMADPPGAAAIRDRDAGFNTQHLEDRASVIFWRWLASWRRGKCDALAKVAGEKFIQPFAERLRQGDGQRAFFADAAVGSVQTQALLPDESIDRALVTIRWEGAPHSWQGRDELKCVGHRSVRKTMFVLGRQAGVQTDAAAAVASSHCPGCGAPETGGTGGRCEYCGETLNDGGRDWILLEILSAASRRARELVLSARSEQEQQSLAGAKAPAGGSDGGPPTTGVLVWMIKTVVADGEISAKEQKMILATAKAHGIPEHTVKALTQTACADGEAMPQPANADEGREWLRHMARAALADGRIDRREKKLLAEVGRFLGFSAYDITALLRREQKSMYKDARQEIRQSRRRAKAG